MNTRIPLIAASLAAACGAALAGTEYGTVISSKAVTAQVSVAQQQCTDPQTPVQPRTTGAGALVGAIVGGVVGHNVGEGFGRAAATGLGVVAGSVIGDRTEAANTPATTVPVRNCQAVNTVENRVVGYDVTYDYNGQRFQTRLAQDPGERIALNVSVSPQEGAVAAAPVSVAPVVTASPPVAYAAASPYPVYVPYPYDGYYGYVGPVLPRVGVVIGGGYRRHRF